MKHPPALHAALRYAEQGIPVLPLWAGLKAPHIKRGVHAATICSKKIIAWWQKWPDADLALACGSKAGFDVLDVDEQHGGPETLHNLLREHGAKLPETARQVTPSGGFHLLFQHQPMLKNRSGGQGLVPAGLDCRTFGAMIRTAPTPGYRWDRPWSQADVAPWPTWLADFYRDVETKSSTGPKPVFTAPAGGDHREQYVATALATIVCDIQKAQPGSQNSILNASSFRVGRLLAAVPHLNIEDVISQLIDAGLSMANQPCRAAWQAHEIEKIVRRAIDDGQSKGPAHIPSLSQ